MSVKLRNLSALGYANGFTLWVYKGFDVSLLEISEPDFFADASFMMHLGDMVLVTTAGTGTVLMVAYVGPETVRMAPLV